MIFDWRPAAAYAAACLLFLFAALAFYWPSYSVVFLSDDSPMSWLSSAQLWAAMVLALRLGFEGVTSRLLAAWLSLAMFVLALDEQFLLHEHWKLGCIDWFAVCRYRWVLEIPTAAVAVLGCLTAVWLFRALPERSMRGILIASLVVGVLAIALDLASQPSWLAGYEEGLEVLAEALFVGGLLGVRHGGAT